MGSEKRYENKIKRLLKDLGAYHVKYFGCSFTQAGVPDILACLKGHFIAIEVKAGNGRPSPLQLHNLREIHRAGGLAILTYPKDFDRLRGLLEVVARGENPSELYEPFILRFID